LSSEDAVAQQLRQGGSKRAPQADGDQNDHVADHVGRCALEDLDDGHTVDLVAGVQAHADRRSDQTGDHHGTELQRREAVLHHDRQQDGGEQQDGRADIDEGADHQDQHIKDQCNGPCGHVQGHEEGTHRLRHLLHGQHPCKDGGKADDEHDGGRRDQGLFQSLPDTLPCQLLVDEEAHQHGIQHGHTGTFGCSAHAEGNADDDEQRHDEGRNAGKQALGGALAVKLDLFRMPALLGADDVHQHQLGQTDQDAGHGTCHEQRTHRCTGDHRVNDHGGGGRDDHAHGGGCHRDTGRSFRRVAFLLHGGDQDGTQSRGIGHRGAGNATEDHGSHDVHFAQTAADGPQQLHAEVDDALGDAAGVHQFASQHEQRHGDHQLTVGTVPHALRQHGNKGRCIDQDVGHTGSADGEGQRDAQRGKEDQQHQKDEHCHSCVFSPFRLCVVTAQRLILGRKVGNIGLVQGDDLDHDADGTDDAAHRHDAVHIHHGDLHALTDLLTGNAHILEALIGEHQHHGQHDEVIDDSQPALAGRLDTVVKDVDHDVLVLDHVDAHAPEGGKCKQGGVELCQLLPAQGEAVARNNGKDHKSCQQCHGDHADGKVYVKQLLADFFQLFDGAQPLSVILQLFPSACYSRGQPAEQSSHKTVFAKVP